MIMIVSVHSPPSKKEVAFLQEQVVLMLGGSSLRANANANASAADL
jgi:hypothetical protein